MRSCTVRAPYRPDIPVSALRIIIHMKIECAIVKIHGAPQPVELGDSLRDGGLRVAGANGADPPTAITRTSSAVDIPPNAIYFNPALPMPVLRHAGIIHKGPRPDPSGEARLFNGECAASKGQIGGYSFMVVDDNAQRFKWFEYLNGDRPDGEIHPFHIQ